MRHYQNDLFDTLEAETLRDRGIELAINADRVTIWKAKAQEWLETTAWNYEEFSSDELIKDIGLPDSGPNQNNVIGAMFSNWAKKKLIKHVGYRQSSRTARHAGVLRVWEKL